MPQSQWIDPEAVSAYMLDGKGATSIIDTESGLITAEKIDDVSEETAIEFDKLLDIEIPQ